MGVRLSTCASHHMLNEDQRALDGLLFGRRIAGRLSDEEGLDTYQRAIEGSRELLAGLHNGGRPGHWKRCLGMGVCGTGTRDGEVQLQPVNGNQRQACHGDPRVVLASVVRRASLDGR